MQKENRIAATKREEEKRLAATKKEEDKRLASAKREEDKKLAAAKKEEENKLAAAKREADKSMESFIRKISSETPNHSFCIPQILFITLASTIEKIHYKSMSSPCQHPNTTFKIALSSSLLNLSKSKIWKSSHEGI